MDLKDIIVSAFVYLSWSLFSLLSVSEIKHHDQKQLPEGKGLFGLHFPITDRGWKVRAGRQTGT